MQIWKRIYQWFEYPHRLLAVRKALGKPPSRVLDVGCGNHSPMLTKRYFPDCVYHGVDRQDWNRDERDRPCTDVLYEVDLEDAGGLSQIEDAGYDAVICSHVLEHLSNPYDVVSRLAAKARPGGLVYVEVPAPASRGLPRAANGWFGIKGCLNFSDDRTHRTMVDLPRIARSLAAAGFGVGPIRRRCLWRRVILLPAYAIAGLLLRGYIPASVVWDVSGFAIAVTARRPEVDGA